MFENQIKSTDTRNKIVNIHLQNISRRKELFTLEELAQVLDSNRVTLTNFEQGKIFNFNLFDQYCGLFGQRYLI